MTVKTSSGSRGASQPVITPRPLPAVSFSVTLASVGAAILLGWDRAVDPGRCAPNPAMGTRRCNVGTGWPAVPTRRGLDCSHGLQCARYLSRSDLGRPTGPAERHAWAKRRTLKRKAQRAFLAQLGHRMGAPWDR